MSNAQPLKVWTVWLNYLSTGEGRTQMACFVNADTEFEAISKFEQKFGEYFAQGCMTHEGVLRNPVTKVLFSKAAMDGLEAAAAKGKVEAFASLYTEFSENGQKDLLGSYT